MDTFWADPAKATLAILATLGILGGIGVGIFKIGGWYGSVNSDRKNFKEFIDKVDRKIEELLEKVSKLPSETLKRTSPIHLTELGESISKELKASHWAKEVAPGLVVQVKGQKAYEIQKFSFDCLKRRRSVLTESMEITVEMCAYEHGLGKTEILDVLAIKLRDELLRLLAIN